MDFSTYYGILKRNIYNDIEFLIKIKKSFPITSTNISTIRTEVITHIKSASYFTKEECNSLNENITFQLDLILDTLTTDVVELYKYVRNIENIGSTIRASAELIKTYFTLTTKDKNPNDIDILSLNLAGVKYLNYFFLLKNALFDILKKELSIYSYVLSIASDPFYTYNKETERNINKIYSVLTTYYTTFSPQLGGGNSNKQLLNDFVAAYLILNRPNSNIPTIKDLIITSIKVNKKIPKSSELLKMFILPLFCSDNKIKVTYDNMTKCIKKNVHKVLTKQKINDYIDLLHLTRKDKLLLKEFDKRVSAMNATVKF